MNDHRFSVDGTEIPFEPGDSVAVAMLRQGEHPRTGTLCLAGDCGNCVAVVDGVAWVRTCRTHVAPGTVVERHPTDGPPALVRTGRPTADRARARRHLHADVVVIGAGDSGTAAAADASAAGRSVTVLDERLGHEVVGVYPGPSVVARTPEGVVVIAADEVVVATGAAELQPVCPGSTGRGILTSRAAEALLGSGVELGRTVCVGAVVDTVPGARPHGGLAEVVCSDNGRVTGVVVVDGDDRIAAHCDTVVVGLGTAPRDVLARMTTGPNVRIVGPAAAAHALPPPPTEGVVCPCSGTTVDDLDGAWDRGFHDLELLKRATLCGTGTCQGSACVPHLRAFVAHRTGATPAPFTGRPASRQLTMGEAATGVHLASWRRTALHEEHLALAARMDRFGGWWRPWSYGDHLGEYTAVRERVSLGDVSTLGKLVVSGPDVVEALERLYPTTVNDLHPGRSRYALLLNERGHIIDDGMICRETDTRFVLTFTSSGATAAEMWVRDWLETWELRVHALDQTMSLGAINVTGPSASALLARVGVPDPPAFLRHERRDVAGVPCHLMRLSFTGEVSFELHHPVDRSVELWRALMNAGEDLGIAPHGLQALFALRLEKGHIIVGMDTELDTTPRRCGMDWAVRLDKRDFLGRDALVRTSTLPDSRRLVGLTMPGEAPVEGAPIWADGDVIGYVTSSFRSPTLGRSVMLGWLKRAPRPDVVEIDGRSAAVEAPPFYDPDGRRARA